MSTTLTIKQNKQTNKPTKKAPPKMNTSTTAVLTSKKYRRALRNRKPTPNAYLELVTNPFNNLAFGAKVSDPFSRYTDAYKIHGEFKIIAPSGTTTAAYIFKPNPFLSVIDVQSWSGGVSTSNATGFTTLGTSSWWAATTPTALASTMTNYRVVAHAVRIRLETNMNTATGRVIIARAPRCRSDPPYSASSANVFDWANQTSAFSPITSVPPNPLLNSPFMLELPESQEFSMLDLMGSDVTIVNKPNSFKAFDFSPCPTSDQFNGAGGRLDEDTVFNSLGARVGGGVSDNVEGWDDFYLYFDGLPSSSVPVANVEIIYHMEGTPAVSSATAITAVPSHPPVGPAPPTTLGQILNVAGRTASLLFTSAPTLYGNVFPGRNLLRDTAGAAALLATGRGAANSASRLRYREEL